MDSLAEAVRYIVEETSFGCGVPEAEMLVAFNYRDWCAETTRGGWDGVPITTSEERAFSDLLYWLKGDFTAVYRVIALFETEKIDRSTE